MFPFLFVYAARYHPVTLTVVAAPKLASVKFVIVEAPHPTNDTAPLLAVPHSPIKNVQLAGIVAVASIAQMNFPTEAFIVFTGIDIAAFPVELPLELNTIVASKKTTLHKRVYRPN